jgi:hypothetical protein
LRSVSAFRFVSNQGSSSPAAAATVAELTSPRHNTVSGFNVSSNYSLFDPFCSTLTQSYNIMDIYDLFFINKDGEEEELGFFLSQQRSVRLILQVRVLI